MFYRNIVIFAAAVVASPSLFGSLLLPGSGAVAPDVFSASTTGLMFQASTGPLVVNPLPGSSFNATYTEYVYAANNTSDGLCVGCLDFFIELTNAGPGVIEHITTSTAPGFSGFSVDVGYNTVGVAGGPAAVPGGVIPVSVDRSGNNSPTDDGSVIDWLFSSGDNITAGESSVLLEIETNATQYVPGTVSVQDGTAGFNVGFAPTGSPATIIPEPASLMLMGSALLALGITRRRLS